MVWQQLGKKNAVPDILIVLRIISTLINSWMQTPNYQHVHFFAWKVFMVSKTHTFHMQKAGQKSKELTPHQEQPPIHDC